ncbi:MAG: hypothetical protein J6Q89_00950 [Clostridia bacterium]|nr:hypothetical protein [Clostridia bacterium]
MDYNELAKKYSLIYDWLATISFGEKYNKSVFKRYTDELWFPIKQMLQAIRYKQDQTALDQQFLNCQYIGEIYRVHNLSSKKRLGNVDVHDYYQSWSRADGLEHLPIHGEKLLIIANADEAAFAIDTFKLLCFILRNFDRYIPNERYNPRYLCRYEEEGEIVMPMCSRLIKDMRIISYKDIVSFTSAEQVPKENWFRKR